MKFYSLEKILKKNATYNIIFGERSNGKTYAALKHAIIERVKHGHELAYLRRWKEDVTGARADRIFSALVENDEIKNITNGEFTGVHYRASKFYLCNYSEDGKVIYSENDVLGYCFPLSGSENIKSNSFPKVNNIIFDEFITNKLYLPDEFVIFMNMISTIVRRREGVKIYLLGNTVNKYCPYFAEMGLNKIQEMKQNSIDVYTYQNGEDDKHSLKLAIEYCKSLNSKASEGNKYFAFDNPKLNMITGGAWEIGLFPHLPTKYKPKDIMLTFFIEFNDDYFQCEVVDVNNNPFVYIHEKTTPIQNPDEDLIYSLNISHQLNYNTNVYKPINNIQKRISWFFVNNKVFYQNNSVGNAISNYLKICKRG